MEGKVSIGMMKRACSLDDISEDTTQLFTLSSPRSAEALACHGMLLEDLQYRPLEEYKERGVPHEVALLRYEHNEAGRRERIKQVKHEYRVICGTQGTRTWNGHPFQVHEDISLFLHLYLLFVSSTQAILMYFLSGILLADSRCAQRIREKVRPSLSGLLGLPWMLAPWTQGYCLKFCAAS